MALDEGTVEALAAHQERQRAAAAEHPTVWRALAGGVDLKLVSGILRHSSITITADTYTSVLPETALAAAEGVAAMRRDRPARPALDDGSRRPRSCQVPVPARQVSSGR